MPTSSVPLCRTGRSRTITLRGTASITGVCAYPTNNVFDPAYVPHIDVGGGSFLPTVLNGGTCWCLGYSIRIIWKWDVYQTDYQVIGGVSTPVTWYNEVVAYAKLSGPGVPDDGIDPATSASMWQIGRVTTVVHRGSGTAIPCDWAFFSAGASATVTMTIPETELLSSTTSGPGLSTMYTPGTTVTAAVVGNGGGPSFSHTLTVPNSWRIADIPSPDAAFIAYPNGRADLTALPPRLPIDTYQVPWPGGTFRYAGIYKVYDANTGPSASWHSGYIGTPGLFGPSGIAPVSGAWGVAGADSLALATPPPGAGAYGVSARLGGGDANQIQMICRPLTPGGLDSKDAHDWRVEFGDVSANGSDNHPMHRTFSYSAVTGDLVQTYKVGGYTLEVYPGDGSVVRREENLPSDTGAPMRIGASNQLGLPLARIVYPGGGYLSARAMAHLPFGQAGGIQLTQAPTYNLYAAPWTIGGAGGWQGCNGVTLSLSGTGSIYLRLTVPTTPPPPSGQHFAAWVPVGAPVGFSYPYIGGAGANLPHRFLRLRFRTVGSANKRLGLSLYPSDSGNADSPVAGLGFSANAPSALPGDLIVTSGADGEWIEAVYDAQRGNLHHEPWYVPSAGYPDAGWISGFRLARQPKTIVLTALEAGTVYEIEYLRGEEQIGSWATHTAPGLDPASLAPILPAMDASTGDGYVWPLHGFTDGLLTMSSNPDAGSGSFSPDAWWSIAQYAQRLNGGYWHSWSAAPLVPRRADKPADAYNYVLPLSDWYDADCSTWFLGGVSGGLWGNHGGTWDVAASGPGQPITLRTQWGNYYCALYPGCGNPFNEDGSAGAYGNTTVYRMSLYTRGQIAGILTGGQGQTLIATDQGTGLEDSRGKSLAGTRGKAGLAVIPAPGTIPTSGAVHQSHPLTITSIPKGTPVHDISPSAYPNPVPAVTYDHLPNITVGIGQRQYVALVTAPVGASEGPCCLNTRQGGYFASAHVDKAASGIRFRRTDGPQVPVSGRPWAVDAIVTGTTALDRRPQLVYDDSARGGAPGGTLRLLFTRYASDPSAGPSGATGGDVYMVTSSDDGATWSTPPVKLDV